MGKDRDRGNTGRATSGAAIMDAQRPLFQLSIPNLATIPWPAAPGIFMLNLRVNIRKKTAKL
jgi:hypothetical protein